MELEIIGPIAAVGSIASIAALILVRVKVLPPWCKAAAEIALVLFTGGAAIVYLALTLAKPAALALPDATIDHDEHEATTADIEETENDIDAIDEKIEAGNTEIARIDTAAVDGSISPGGIFAEGLRRKRRRKDNE